MTSRRLARGLIPDQWKSADKPIHLRGYDLGPKWAPSHQLDSRAREASTRTRLGCNDYLCKKIMQALSTPRVEALPPRLEPFFAFEARRGKLELDSPRRQPSRGNTRTRSRDLRLCFQTETEPALQSPVFEHAFQGSDGRVV